MEKSGSFVSRIPVLGWMLTDAVNGRPDAKYWFAFNIVIILALAVWFIGYPFVIILALFGTFGMMSVIIALTAGDLIARFGPKSKN